jgi:hypothetical protein
MADGTTGLGQSTTVFDFTKLGQTGLFMDEARRQRKQQFVKDNATLYESIDTQGIREVDKPYINEQVENAMELSALAQKTRNPEDAQRARLAMDKASRLAKTSQTASLQHFNTFAEFKKTAEYNRDPERYERYYREHQNATAFTSNNDGQISTDNLLFEAPTFLEVEKNMADFIGVDATNVINASYERTAFSTTHKSGRIEGEDKAEINVEKKDAAIQALYESQMHGNTDFREAVEAQVMADYFGTTDLATQQTAKFQEMREYGRELTDQYGDDIEALRADRRFINNPVALAQAEEAYYMENSIVERGYELYYDAVAAKAKKGTNFSEVDNYAAGVKGEGYDPNKDYALSRGATAEEAIGGDIKIKDNAMEHLEGSTIGYSSMEGMKLRPRGSGSKKVIVGGVLAQKKSDDTYEFFAVEYQPSPDILTKIEEGGDAAALLATMEANIVPLSAASAGIPAGQIPQLKQNAFEQAGGKGKYTDPEKSNKAPR